MLINLNESPQILAPFFLACEDLSSSPDETEVLVVHCARVVLTYIRKIY